MSEGEYLRHKGTLVPLYLPTSYHCFTFFAMIFITKFCVDFVSVLCIYNFFIAFAQLELPAFVHIITACVLRPVMLW